MSFGSCYLGLQRSDEVTSYFSKWLDYYPDNEEAYLMISNFYKTPKNYPELIKVYRCAENLEKINTHVNILH